MNLDKQCENCGETLSANTLRGLCPNCLLKAGLFLALFLISVSAALLAMGVPPWTRHEQAVASLAAPAMKLTGTVLDADTGKPIAGALVASLSLSRVSQRTACATWTDQAGRFKILTRDEPQSLSINAERYQASEKELPQIGAFASQTAPLSLKLKARPPLVPPETKASLQVFPARRTLEELVRLLNLSFGQVAHQVPTAHSTLQALFCAYADFNGAVRDTDLELPFSFVTTIEQAMAAVARSDWEQARILICRLRQSPTAVQGMLQRRERLDGMLAGRTSSQRQ